MRFTKRRIAAIVGAGLAASVLVASSVAAIPVGTVDYLVTNRVGVMQQGCDQTSVAVGATIKCGVKVVASSPITADEVVIAARGPSGEVVDFPSTPNYAVGSTVQTYEASRSFTVAGTYTYFFSYRVGTQWTTEEPTTRTFSVTSGAPATPAVISFSEAPNPADTTQSVAFTAHLWAQSQTVNTLVFACRTSSGGNCDFGHLFNYAFNGTDQTFTANKTFTAAGTYTVWVAYNNASGWHDLAPTHTVTINAPPGGGQLPQGSSGSWTLRFQDEFSGTAVDTQKWNYQSPAEALWCSSPLGTGNPNNQQLEFDQPSNATVSGGNLNITAQPANINACGRHYDWSSALLTTYNTPQNYNFRYAWIEARVKMPSIKGFWPAFWTWAAPGNGTYTETDVFEYYSDNHTRIYQTQHSGSGGGCITTTAFDPAAGFHTYGANITPSGTDFYIDGGLMCHASGIPAGNANLLLDNFVYSVIPPDPGTSGVTQFDYVRTWTTP